MPLWKLLLIGYMVPLSLGIRGWQEMHMLNGAAQRRLCTFLGELS